MKNKINYVDICCGLNWGDEAKGKIVSYLAKTGIYDFVCRWSGGNNAGHTIYKDGIKYKTHLIPSGIFYGIPSIIGPDCVVNQDAFFEEIKSCLQTRVTKLFCSSSQEFSKTPTEKKSYTISVWNKFWCLF